ncbi:hypothetical protein XH89_14545 [Bradyrhizobium sp. CCBAU 53340]|nr:hypothetical protein XH89_14545 [Bradyrhizobium sp. CCBAU 53340]
MGGHPGYAACGPGAGVAAECELIAKRANESNRGLYLRAGQHYCDLANDMRALIASFDVAA